MSALGRRIGVMVAVLVVVGLLGFAGVHNLRARRAAMEQAKQAQITLVKDGAADRTTGDAGGMGTALQGKVAPGFTLVDLAGKKVSLADYKGHAVVLNFWATWCGPCKLEMPWFEEFAAKYKDQGVVVLGVDQDELDTPKGEIEAAVKKTGVTYPVLLPDKAIAKTYALADYLPETFYLDKNGIVVEHSLGAPPKDEVEAHIKKALQ